MHKDELLQLHSLLCQVKRFFHDAGLPAEAAFADYEDLEVSPQHIHKSKTDHKRAVFLLGKGMADLVMEDDPDHRDRLKERFGRLADGKKGLTPVAERAANAPAAKQPAPREDHLPAFALQALRH